MIKKKITSFISAAAIVIASVPAITSDVDTTVSTTVYASEEYSVPNLNIAGKKIPDTESFHFVNDMGAGFNLGNTFEAIDNAGAVEGDANMYLETSWLSDGEAGVTTTETIDAIKNAGFKTVRIPVSWHNHLDSDFNINEDWLGKVSSIVNYALSQDMYVILNIHHDCEKSSGFTSPDYDPEWATGNKDCYIYPDNEHLESSVKYVTRIWEQLSEKFKDCDNHLIFETMNEPRQVGNIHEWWYADDDCCHEALECITQINQAAVDAIRKSGGNNSDRYIMVPATSAKAEAAMQSKYFQMPEDSAKDRLILSVHAYEPFDFSMDKTSEGAPTEFTDAMKKSLDDMFDTLYVAFIQQNIPVVIGEFGATNRDNTQARTNHAAYYYAAARARGITCCMWDNSNAEGDNEAYRFLDRTNKEFIYDSIAEAAEKYGAPRKTFSGGGVDGVVVNSNCTLYPDGKVMFPSAVGEKAEIYFDIDTTKSLCGGGALCFNLNVDGKGYWIGYPFRAGVEWDSSQNKNMPVPYTVDLTALSEMNAVCWSENRQVTDYTELEKLSKICQESTSAEIQIWWSLDLNWGDRPDSSVTAGKSESEVSELKAAAAKECIAVINVRPMNLPLDTNMGCGSWNSASSEEYTVDDISNFQSFLVKKNTLDLNEKNYDLNNDGALNVIDLCIMKRQYENKQNEGRPVIEGEKGVVSIKDNKITFQHGIGSEMILEVEHNDCVGGGGCISFIETVDDNEYWVAYEWQTNETGVVKIDMTTPDQVTLNDVKVEESQNSEIYKKLGELCMQEKEANLFYWWAAQSWGNNYPDGTDLTKYLTVRSAHITSPLT
ncbi:cellulase family glycosylhydrolase [Porcipelethomonas sp.]|uniref:cellulase family glycosylhydrolase n=1 Tax=Porcipelethomonas sp. TaxID=2981675 RepID=UPI003EF5042B